MALSRRTGEVRWRAQDPNGAKYDYGNVRSSPAVQGGHIVYGDPYSNHMVVMGHYTGAVERLVPLGQCFFPHYPSPAIVGTMAILPRHDGGLYAVDMTSWKTLWSIYLGKADKAGTDFPNLLPKERGECAWEPEGGSSFFASPAISADGRIVVGTGEGYLFCVGE